MNQPGRTSADRNPWNTVGSVSAKSGLPSKASDDAPTNHAPQVPVPTAPAPAAPLPGPEPGPAPAAPQTFPPAPQQPVPAAKSTGVLALIFGIASILLCFLPIISTIMGIAAIALAIRSARRAEYSGALTAGKITGIIGTVLSILVLILIILSITVASRMYGSFGSSASNISADQGYTPDQQRAWTAVEDKMDALASQNEQDAAAIAGLFTQYVNDDAELAPYMQGCDPALYATWSVLGLEYEDDGVFIADQEGYAYVNVTARDGFELVGLWSDLLDQAAADPGLADTTDEEFAQIFTDTYLQALAASNEMYETTIVLDLQQDADGTWSVVEESWDEALAYLFGL